MTVLATALAGAQSATATLALSEYYYFHGYAPASQDDTVFRDASGAGNNGIFGANLSRAQAWASSGYVSTVDPATGATDSTIRIPSLNFDYNGGEKLILWWLGQATPEAADETIMGDAAGASASVGGLRFRAKTTGKVDMVVYGAGSVSQFTGQSAGVPFDGTLHSFAYAIDGGTKKYALWVDELLDAGMAGGYVALAAGAAIDTRNSNTFNIGTGTASPGNLSGMATKTRALIVLRLAASTAMPEIAKVTALLRGLRAAPQRSVLKGSV